ncbi:MAG: hypothetical protein NBKEAIPA_03362 [Nitrospirae bacterium]|nr:MAG: putative arsenite S-adenosylmethyltransferase [Nitrospira sp. OLB3]MBV6471430.1 hypothetical protein [Nitrospirota bacterium]MCK6492186.1 hypothetical protein [Nitrospira sp.]MEB2339380.1 hypothetical protein [Nitrospirales bacterium]
MDAETIRKLVKEKYGAAAERATSGGSACCGASPALTKIDPIPPTCIRRRNAEGCRLMR